MQAKASRPRHCIILISRIVDAYLDSMGRVITQPFCALGDDRLQGLLDEERNPAIQSNVEHGSFEVGKDGRSGQPGVLKSSVAVRARSGKALGLKTVLL